MTVYGGSRGRQSGRYKDPDGNAMKKGSLLVDMTMFAATIALAVLQEWTAKDIVWGLWISSLLLGYSYIVTGALSIYVHGKLPGDANNGKPYSLGGGKGTARVPPIFMNIPVAVICFMFLGAGSGLAWAIILISVTFTTLGYLLSGKDGSGV